MFCFPARYNKGTFNPAAPVFFSWSCFHCITFSFPIGSSGGPLNLAAACSSSWSLIIFLRYSTSPAPLPRSIYFFLCSCISTVYSIPLSWISFSTLSISFLHLSWSSTLSWYPAILYFNSYDTLSNGVWGLGFGVWGLGFG